MYFSGKGVKEDPKEAIKWLEKAAIAGNVDAQTFIGNLYYKGIGVARDNVKAGYWLQKAAIAGDADAQATLNDLLGNGEADGTDTAGEKER